MTRLSIVGRRGPAVLVLVVSAFAGYGCRLQEGSATEGGGGGTNQTAPTLVTDRLLQTGHAGDPSNWPMYGGDYGQPRFSPLAQINRDNVERLESAWVYRTGVGPTFETTPVVVGGEMFITTPMEHQVQHVIKLDARTGRALWRTPVPQQTTIFCCGPNNRGVALYGDKVFLATLDARVVALSAATGDIEWETTTGKAAAGYGHTLAPLTYDGKVIVGTSGGEFGIRGWVKALDTATGETLWTWYAIPSPEEGGWWGEWLETAPGTTHSLNRDIAAEKRDSARYADAWERGGGPVWMTPALDPDLGLLYVSVGNVSPDYDGTVRPGDNRWNSSVCAIRVDEGETEWCYQYVPHDVWDYDATSPPFLFALERDGQSIPAVGHFAKVGFFYAWDRRTGELLQRSQNYVPHHNLFTVPTRQGVLLAPGIFGGTNWSPGAHNPETGYVYTTAMHWPMVFYKNSEPYEEGEWYVGGGTRRAEDTERWGSVVALDPATGEVAWEYRTERPLMGGALTTAGGLVFAGQTMGSFNAWDAATGELLWRHPTDAGCNAAPITYELDGTQHVAVACGGNSRVAGRPGDALRVFRLP